MPIFSGNRVSAGSMSIVANENYGEHDFGRILYECALNDSMVFNSALLREFKEVEAVREGTMMESELRSFQEFSAKEAWNGLKEKMKKLWEKIKGIFKQVTAKLAVWFVRNGKAYVKANKHLLTADVAGCKIPKYRKKTEKYDRMINNSLARTVKDIDFSKAQSTGGSYQNASRTADEIAKMIYLNIFGESVDASNVNKAFMDAAFDKENTEPVEFGKLGVSVAQLFEVIGNGKKPIKDLKKAESEADKSIKKVIKEIEKAKSKVKEGESTDSYSNASKYCTAYQSVLTNATKALIAMVKFDVKQSRAVIAKLAAYSPVKESALFEMSCWMEAAEEVEEELDSVDPADAEADDVKVEIDISSDEGVDVEVNED